MTSRHARDAETWARRLREADVAAPLAEPLGAYLSILVRWSAAVDLLSGIGDSMIAGLVLDSLAALPLLGPTGTLLDVGSGNGVPAIPLLLARPGMRGVLLEPRERRWAFLREVVRALNVPAEVVRERVAEHRGGSYTVVTVRGVAMGAWLPHADRLLHPDGTWLWWTSATNAAGFAGKVRRGRVLTFPLPEPGRGCLAAWRPCST